jgi:FMN phosphatase YigB (HAD superfamily)
MAYRAVIFDLGGVVFPSPFEAFDAYDHGNDLKKGTMRALIRRSSESGAWAALERGDLDMDEFVDALEAEALATGLRVDARRLMGLIGSSLGPRPEMERALREIRARGLRTGALTNNWACVRPDCSTSSWSRRWRGCASPTRASTRWRSRA